VYRNAKEQGGSEHHNDMRLQTSETTPLGHTSGAGVASAVAAAGVVSGAAAGAKSRLLVGTAEAAASLSI
jgi:hypothetical protein